jgi:hypothetical protein
MGSISNGAPGAAFRGFSEIIYVMKSWEGRVKICENGEIGCWPFVGQKLQRILLAIYANLPG